LHDPLGLSESLIVVPQALMPLLYLADGTRDLAAMRASLMVRYGLALSEEKLADLLGVLNDAYLLENAHYEAARYAAVEAYRAAPSRPISLAGQSYPADPGELAAYLDGFLAQAPQADPPACSIRGVVSPHIDYMRGGAVYAAVWRAAEGAAREAELVVILGTDHYGSPGQITLTRQSYATPYGVLPTDLDAVDALAQALGEPAAYAEELHHRGEHAVELSAVWLHHMRGGAPVPLVPVLCGSFGGYVQNGVDPATDPQIAAFVGALHRILGGRRALLVASADLAHVGPAFGGPPHGALEKAALRQSDQAILERICAGDAAGFFSSIAAVGDRDNVCGLPPITLFLQALAPTTGRTVAYAQCIADERETSWVSVCGAVLA
jgi:hypothetical protein